MSVRKIPCTVRSSVDGAWTFRLTHQGARSPGRSKCVASSGDAPPGAIRIDDPFSRSCPKRSARAGPIGPASNGTGGALPSRFQKSNATIMVPCTRVSTGATLPHVMDRLNAGDGLHVNDSLTSPSGEHLLTLQPDGNLVLYQQEHQPVWATGTVLAHSLKSSLAAAEHRVAPYRFRLSRPQGAAAR